jgi:hypothetical protein
MPDFGNWTDVVHYPLSFAAFILFLVYRLVKSRKADTVYPRVFLGLAVVALLSALVLASVQTPPTDPPLMKAVEKPPTGEAAGLAGANDPPAKAAPSGGESQRPDQVIIQKTDGGPAVAGVNGNVEINVNQPSGTDQEGK